MLKDPITVLVQSNISGPGGIKLKPGKIHILEDSPYVRILVKSGSVSLIDPPSLDLEFLEAAGYELRDGYAYPIKSEPEKPVEKVVESSIEKAVEKPPVDGYLTKISKKVIKVSEEPSQKASKEEKKDSAQKGWSPKEITGM